MAKTEWEKKASNLLKAELARRGLAYEDLKTALAKIGVEKSAHALNKTINLGKFSFALFLQCAEAIELDKLQIK
jgi:hypothetical protein